jgi:guanine deaminase
VLRDQLTPSAPAIGRDVNRNAHTPTHLPVLAAMNVTNAQPGPAAAGHAARSLHDGDSKLEAPRPDIDAAAIERVVQLAVANVEAGGRPFACVIASTATGVVLAEAANQVAQSGDPTAHAEILAIRAASAILRARGAPVDGKNGGAGEDYRGYTFYILTDPCAMCCAAMYYTGCDGVVYATTRGEYARHYRDDRRHFKMESFYAEIAKPHAEKTLPVRQVAHPAALAVYKRWEEANAPGSGAPPAHIAPAGRPVGASGNAAGSGCCPFSHAAAAAPAAAKPAASTALGGPTGAAALPATPAALQPGAQPPATVLAGGHAGAGMTSRGATPLPTLLSAGDIDARRPEVLVDGKPVPAWGRPEELAPILAAPHVDFARLLEVVSIRGDTVQAYYAALTDVHLTMRDAYAKMIHAVGRNIYPLIVASDYEPGFAGVGSTFTLFLADGTSKRIAVSSMGGG